MPADQHPMLPGDRSERSYRWLWEKISEDYRPALC